MICPNCGETMRTTEKDKTGRDVREYLCPTCGHSDWEDRGAALWPVLSDRERDAIEEEEDA